jgi:hypothetical protein
MTAAYGFLTTLQAMAHWWIQPVERARAIPTLELIE